MHLQVGNEEKMISRDEHLKQRTAPLEEEDEAVYKVEELRYKQMSK